MAARTSSMEQIDTVRQTERDTEGFSGLRAEDFSIAVHHARHARRPRSPAACWPDRPAPCRSHALARHIDQHPLPEFQRLQVAAIAAQRELIVGAAIHILEYAAWHAPLRERTQILDAVDDSQDISSGRLIVN